MSENAFTLLGLPERFSIDKKEIEDAWRQRLALVHPDRFAAAGVAAQRVAEQWASRLNDAKVELLNDATRAKVLLAAKGVALDEERDTKMPPDFLLKQFEYRERIDAGESNAVLSEIKEERATLLKTISTTLDKEEDCERARDAVRKLLFVEKLLTEASEP